MLRTRAPLTIASPFDLHVLGPPQTFALSQDQTLQFELALIMAEQLVGAARPVVGVALLFSQRGGDPTGCGLEVHVPTSVVLVSLFHYPVFRERLASAGPFAGWETYARSPVSSSFFLSRFSQVRPEVPASRSDCCPGREDRVARREAGSTPYLVPRQAPFRGGVSVPDTRWPKPQVAEAEDQA